MKSKYIYIYIYIYLYLILSTKNFVHTTLDLGGCFTKSAAQVTSSTRQPEKLLQIQFKFNYLFQQR